MNGRQLFEACVLCLALADTAYSAPEGAPLPIDVLNGRKHNIVGDPRALTRSYVRWFATMTNDQLIAQCYHSDASVAIQSAWELLQRRSGHINTAHFGEYALVNRYLGFVEGTLRSPVPSWWSSALFTAEYSGERSVDRLTILDGYLSDSYRLHEESGLLMPKAMEILQYDEKRCVFRRDGKKYSIDRELLDEAIGNFDPDALTVTSIDDSTLAIACYHGMGSQYRLALVDLNANKVRWRTSVWSKMRVPGGSGLHPMNHHVHIVKAGDTVRVFGALRHCLYIEGFALDSGENRLRFSTSYSEKEPP